MIDSKFNFSVEFEWNRRFCPFTALTLNFDILAIDFWLELFQVLHQHRRRRRRRRRRNCLKVAIFVVVWIFVLHRWGFCGFLLPPAVKRIRNPMGSRGFSWVLVGSLQPKSTRCAICQIIHKMEWWKCVESVGNDQVGMGWIEVITIEIIKFKRISSRLASEGQSGNVAFGWNSFCRPVCSGLNRIGRNFRFHWNFATNSIKVASMT